MSARIPHLLTRLLASDELDALESAMLDRANDALGTPDCTTWCDAVQMIRNCRDASLDRRSNQTPSARRKSLGLRYTR